MILKHAMRWTGLHRFYKPHAKMKEYIVTGTAVTINAGSKVGMTEKQAARRVAFLSVIDKKAGIYQATGRFQFKNGEKFRYDGTLPKESVRNAEDPEELKKRNDAELEAEKNKFITERVEKELKRMKTADLENFYLEHCNESTFPEDDSLTNPKRIEWIMEWFKDNGFPEDEGEDE